MNWQTLISSRRYGKSNAPRPLEERRTEFQRDYDRLIFSAAFRRMQNKTQVFPLPGSIFVHNRLTHSLEVSSVGRSLGTDVARELVRLHPGLEQTEITGMGAIVSAACLAHDLGNPPFGHSGEKAIAAFFSEGEGQPLKDKLTAVQWTDVTNFEGNANSLRALTNQFHGRRSGGFAMTYSTLASVVKYPYDSQLAGQSGKFGFFDTESATYRRIADELDIPRLPSPPGTVRYARHPLVYIVEAADDICYEVMDLEDAHKLKILTTAEVIDTLMAYFPAERHDHLQQVMDTVEDPNEKIAYLRSSVVGRLVESSANVFLENEQAILDGTFEGHLLDHLPTLEKDAYAGSCELSCNKIYNSADVVDIELAGNRIITFLLSKLTGAVCDPGLYYSRLLLSQVPGQYDVHAPDLFTRVQAVLDHVSAMTDVYALDLYRKLNGMSLPAV